MRSPSTASGRLSATLGPTNTGKTHRALARLMSHPSGVVGFPLRLLARENYDKVVRIKGPGQVALLTGEEKIVPPQARYYLCTVESMPPALFDQVSFVAVDEVQLCADPERGHVFTDRLLHARGRRETMLLGADTVAPLLRQLVPEAEIEAHPRFSTLSYTGHRSLNRLPPRSAIVAFSAADVYAIAEFVRRQKGGAAVVLGALSPRTRNAQVALYQAGEVEYIVATDAVGMGLNMDVGHVAFAGLSKFDGRQVRALSPAELAQVAGRAGRHRSDGTFGVTGDAPPLDPAVVEQLEAHCFSPLQRLYWRNTELRFTSVDALLNDLQRPPPNRRLVRPEAAEDERALAFLAKDPELLAAARGAEAVRLLWEVCQIPDFRKTLSDAHPRLLGEIYLHLRAGNGHLPEDWVAHQVQRLERLEGDIDALTQRIAAVRTWTYVSHKAAWLRDARHWQERTRSLEDRLSDALHEQLTLRFVDRRTSALVKGLRERGRLEAAVTRTGDVLVEGHRVGRLEGLHFAAEGAESPLAAKAVHAAAARVLEGEIARRVDAFDREPDASFSLEEDGRILWAGVATARLRAGPDVLRPRVEPLAAPFLDGLGMRRVRERLVRWFDAHRRLHLGPLLPETADAFAGAARGLLFQLGRGLGSVARSAARVQIDALTRADRRALRGLGVHFGRESVYLPALWEPEAAKLRSALWTAFHDPEAPLLPPPPHTLCMSAAPGTPRAYYDALGYRVCGTVAARLDVLERLSSRAWARAAEPGGRFEVDAAFLQQTGCDTAQVSHVLAALGYVQDAENGETPTFRRRREPRRRRAA